MVELCDDALVDLLFKSDSLSSAGSKAQFVDVCALEEVRRLTCLSAPLVCLRRSIVIDEFYRGSAQGKFAMRGASRVPCASIDEAMKWFSYGQSEHSLPCVPESPANLTDPYHCF